MITSFEIENFKAFKNRQRIPLKPITLIYGPNSAGKSSVIQALLYFQNLAETKEADIDTITIGDSNLNIRGFSNLINSQDINKEMSFKTSFISNKKNNIELEFSLKKSDTEVIFTSIYISIDGENLISSKERVIDINFNNIYITKICQNKLLENLYPPYKSYIENNFNIKLNEWLNRFNTYDFTKNRIYLNSDKLVIKFSDEKYIHDNNIIHGSLRGEANLRNGYNKVFGSYSNFSRFLGINNQIPDDVAAEMIKHHKDYEVPKLNQEIEIFKNKTNEEKDKIVLNYLFGKSLNIISDITNEVISTIKDKLHDVIHVPNFRKISQREDHSFKKYHYYDLLNSNKHRNFINSVIARKKLFTNRYSFEVKNWIVEDYGLNKSEIFIKDNVSNLLLNFEDLGTGVSQILPILMYVYGVNYHRICIEQPELHLHPKLQSEISDFLIESALDRKFGNQFLIETHSEHLLLRIMKRIRQTTHGGLPDDIPPITPDDVAVLYVNPTEYEGSEILELRLDEDGEFIDPWPDGFFEEGYNDLF